MIRVVEIYRVRIDGIEAELEIGPDRIVCSSGDIVHFAARRDDLRLVDHIRYDIVLLNFFQDGSLVQVLLRSQNCLAVAEALLHPQISRTGRSSRSA